LVAILGAIALLKNLSAVSSRPERLRGRFGPSFQIDVLKQEAAFPGKVIRATEKGKEILSYRCVPEDAAVALVSVRERTSGANLVPHILSAFDPDGRSYAAALRSTGRISLICLEHGFAKRPKSVAVTIEVGPIASPMPQSVIQFTDIAEGRRLVAVPAPANAPVTAIFEDRRGFLSIKPTGPLPANEGIEPLLMATSFGAGTHLKPGLPFLSFLFPQNTGIDIDAVRVRLNRIRYTESEATLVYRNATQVEADGYRYLQFPTRQFTGSILDFDAFIGPVRFGPRTFPKAGERRGQIFVRLNPHDPQHRTPEPGEPDYEPPPILSLIDVWPKPEDLGFSSVRVRLLEPSSTGAANSGFEQTILSKGTPTREFPFAIPNLKIRVRIRKPAIISSTTVVLPVRHIEG
jgi:hypothetical protein